jgi:hypothetical protein
MTFIDSYSGWLTTKRTELDGSLSLREASNILSLTSYRFFKIRLLHIAPSTIGVVYSLQGTIRDVDPTWCDAEADDFP